MTCLDLQSLDTGILCFLIEVDVFPHRYVELPIALVAKDEAHVVPALISVHVRGDPEVDRSEGVGANQHHGGGDGGGVEEMNLLALRVREREREEQRI